LLCVIRGIVLLIFLCQPSSTFDCQLFAKKHNEI
jgi:hypothetical protein